MEFIEEFVIGWGKDLVALLVTLAAIFFDSYDKTNRRLLPAGRYLLPVVVLLAITQGVSGWIKSQQTSEENGARDWERATEAARYANQVFPTDVVAVVSHSVTLPTSKPPRDPAIFSQPWRVILRLTRSASLPTETAIEIELYPEVRDHTYRFADRDDYVAHVHEEKTIFVGKYGYLDRFASADSWNGATMSVSLRAPDTLELNGVRNALASPDAAEHARQVAAEDYKGLTPQIESLPGPIAVSLFVRNRSVGTVSGLWARVTLVDEDVKKFNAETFGNLHVEQDLFPLPNRQQFVHPQATARHVLSAVGATSVGLSLLLIGMAVTAQPWSSKNG